MELVKVRAEIVELEKEMESKLSSTELKELSEKCTTLKETYEKQITEMKLSKFRRDTLDYKHDRVYSWWKTTDGHRPHHQRQEHKRGFFSASSGQSTDDSANEGPPTTKKRGQRFLDPTPPTGHYTTRSREGAPGGAANATTHRPNATQGHRY